MKHITLQAIPHDRQRYATAGDYFETREGLHVMVSKMKDPRYEFLVALHELVEAKLCEHRGVKIEDIDTFDFAFEAGRAPGDESEPGDDPEAPYFKEHQIATLVEKLIALELGVDWKQYEQTILELPKKPQRRIR